MATSMDRVADLDELLLRCRGSMSRIYIEEAIASYRASAYRACIVTTWIAVVFDIIEKIREIALFGSEEAKRQIEEFEKWQTEIDRNNMAVLPRLLEFERTILSYVRDKFELIDGQQFIDLSRLHDDRNRCAHPTLQREGTPYQPTGEVARAHLCHAIIHLIQHPPVQGRSALAELRKRVSSAYFPRDSAQAKQALAGGIFARPSDALVRGAIDELLFGFFTPGNSYHRNPNARSALQAVIEIRRDIAEPRLKDQFKKIIQRLPDDELPFLMSIIFSIPECRLIAFSSASLTQNIEAYIKLSPPTSTTGGLLEKCYEHSEFKNAVIEKLNSFDVDSLAILAKSGLKKAAVERAVDLFCSASNWGVANTIADSLIIPLLDYLEKRHIERIIKSPLYEAADLRGSHGFSQFLSKIREENLISKTELDQLLTDNNMEYYIPKSDAVLSEVLKQETEKLPF